MSNNINNTKHNNSTFNNLKGGDKNKLGNSTKFVALPAKHLEVRIYDGNVDRAIKAFRSLVQKERILSAYKAKQSYEKPSVKKRRKKNEYIKNVREAEFREKEEKKNK